MKKKFNVGEILAKYKAVPANKEEKKLLKKENINLKFMAASVGNHKGQAAIFPIDDFGEEKAREFARMFADMLNEKINEI